MYFQERFEMIEVCEKDEFYEMYNALKDCDLKRTPFADKLPSEREMQEYLSRVSIDFFNVYYENVLMGYILLERRSSRTADFHWGVIKESRYLPKVIAQAFAACCKLGIANFIGWTPSNNKLALKVALRMGFEIQTELDNYFSDGESVTLSKYTVF